jgi:hypothetical protein
MKWDYLAFMTEYSNGAIKELIEHQIDDDSIRAMFGDSDKAVDLFTAYFESKKYHKEVYDIIEYAIKQFTLGGENEI